MSNGKFKVFTASDYGEQLPDDEIFIHCGADGQGDGYICGYKMDYDDGSENPAQPTNEPVTCPLCINVLESAANYRKRNGKWY